MASFSDRMRLYRTMRELTQEDVAKRLGTNKQMVSRYEKGDIIPRMDKAVEIAEKLRVDLFWLIGIDDIKRENNDPNRRKLCCIIEHLSDEKIV